MKASTIPNLAVHVSNAAVALSCSIELADLRHSKTLHEGFPNTGTQSIPYCQTNFVTFLRGADRLR